MVQVSLVGPKTPTSKLLPMEPEQNQNINVYVRCRPIKSNEKRGPVEVIPEHKLIRINDRIGTSTSASMAANNSKTFSYDSVFTENALQIDVYRSVVEPLIQQVILGYNCTVFAYGQTGTGKTFTMEGERTSEDSSWEDDPLSGIIPRALHQLFETLADVSDSEHTVRVSFLELYNEDLYDLLSPLDDCSKLKVFDDPARKGSVFINGLEEISVQNKEEIYEILRRGSAKRQTAATLLNACSSRSHTIFSVTVHIKESSLDGEELIKVGKLNLVDLAGSENIGRSGAIEKRAREAGNINQSLLTLGRVITCLVEKSPHIPYRESKLTRLLKDSLGGRTKTSIIATISPGTLDFEDTISTLEYAQRAKKITNKPEINQKLSKKTLLREYTAEIERLRRDLNACREKTGFFVDEANYKDLVQQVEDQSKTIEEKQNELFSIKEQLDRYMKLFEETIDELEIKRKTLEKTETNLKLTEISLNEKKYVLDIYVDNERKLYEQANILLDVIKRASNDANLLLKKSSGLNELESTNFSEINSFESTFQEKIKEFIETIDMSINSTDEMFANVEPKLAKNFVNIFENIEKVQNSNKILNDKFNFFIGNLITLQNGKSFIDEINDSQEKRQLFNQELINNNQNVIKELNEAQSSNETIINNLTAEINKQKEEMKSIFDQEKSRLVMTAIERKTSLSKIKTFFEENFQSLNKNFVETEKKVENHNLKRKQSKEEMNEKISSLITFTDELKKSFNESLINVGEQLNNLKSKFEHNDCNISIFVKEIEDSINLNKQVNEKANDDFNALYVNMNKQENICKAEEDSFFNQVNSLQDKNNDLNINNLNEFKISIDNSNVTTSKSIVAINEKIMIECKHQKETKDEMIEKLNTHFNDLNTFTNENTSELINKHKMLDQDISQVNNDVNLADKETKTNLNTIKTRCKVWWTTLRRQLTEFKEHDGHVVNRLRKYKTTGITPKKCDYVYPENLVKSSNEDELITLYREEQMKKEEKSINEDESQHDNESEPNSLISNEKLNSLASSVSSLNASDCENRIPSENLSKVKKNVSDSNLIKGKQIKKQNSFQRIQARKKLSVKEMN